MERQFTRFDDFDNKLEESNQRQSARFETLEANLMIVMEKQAGVGATMNQLSNKISTLMNMIANVNIHTVGQVSHLLTPTSAATPTMAMTTKTPLQAPSLSDFSERQLDRVFFPSPKNKYRAGSKNNDVVEEIGAMKDDDDTDECMDRQTPERFAIDTAPSDATLTDHVLENLPPFSQAINTPLPDEGHTESQQPPIMQGLEDITSDLENRYIDPYSSQGREPAP